jgi:hypothetical protein
VEVQEAIKDGTFKAPEIARPSYGILNWDRDRQPNRFPHQSAREISRAAR